MDDRSKDPDRAILEAPRAYRTEDLEQTLTDAELDLVLRHFGAFENAKKPDLRSAVNGLFQRFVVMAFGERLHGHASSSGQVQKPSTIVAREMQQVRKACEELDKQLAGLNPATRTWLDQHLKTTGVKDEHSKLVQWRQFAERINSQIDQLIHAAHCAEGLASPGPNNAAQWFLIDNLAWHWETCHGKPPTTDKARGRQADPFQELCQEMASIGDARLIARGGRLGALELSGLVADVLKARRSKSTSIPREK